MAETIKDAEFEAFLTQLRSETPDMGILKSGMEKFGAGYFSDAQKAAFLKEVFPAPVQAGAKESEKLGFQNLNGIKNSLGAMQELSAEGKINDEQMKSFLTMTNPENGRNVLTTIGLNTWAAEKKDKKIRNEGSADFVSLLEKQENTMIDIQQTLGKVKPELLAQAANTPDNSHGVDGAETRRLTYRELASKSPLLMKDNLEKMAPYFGQRNNAQQAPENVSALNIESEKTALNIGSAENFKVGGNENAQPVNIDGQPKPQPQEPNPEENPEEKVATMEDAGPDPKRGKRQPGEFGIVKEQDIIDYMFQSWFLGGLNTLLEGTYKLADRAIDALTGGFENAPRRSSAARASSGGGSRASAGESTTPAGSGSASREGDQTSSYAAQLDGLANRCAAEYTNLAEKIAGDPVKIAAITQCIQRHIGQEPAQWKPQFVAGQQGAPQMVFNPKEHTALIKQLNSIYRKNPQAFTKRMETLLQNPKMIQKVLNPSQIALASHLATIEYAAQHPGEELAGNAHAKEKIGKNTFTKVMELTATLAQIKEKNEQAYRLEHNIKPDQKLSSAEQEKMQKAVDEKTMKEMGEYYDGVANKAQNIKDLLIKHSQEQDASKKVVLEQQIKQAHKDFREFYGQYLQGGHEDGAKEGERAKPETSTLPGPFSLTEEAKRRNQADGVQKDFQSMITNNLADLSDQRAQNQTRHQNFVMKRNEIQGNNPQIAAQQTFYNAVFGQKRGRNG